MSRSPGRPGPAAPPASLDEDDILGETKSKAPASAAGAPASAAIAPVIPDTLKFEILLKQTLAGDQECKDAFLKLIRSGEIKPDVLGEWAKKIFFITQYENFRTSGAFWIQNIRDRPRATRAELKNIEDSLSLSPPRSFKIIHSYEVYADDYDLSLEQRQILYFILGSFIPLLPFEQKTQLVGNLLKEANALFHNWSEYTLLFDSWNSEDGNKNKGTLAAFVRRLLWLNNTPEMKPFNKPDFRSEFYTRVGEGVGPFVVPLGVSTLINYQLLIDLDRLWTKNRWPLKPDVVIECLLKDPLLSSAKLYDQIEKIPDEHFPLLKKMITPTQIMRCVLGFFEVCLKDSFFADSILSLTEPKKGFFRNLFASTPTTKKWIWLLQNSGNEINNLFDHWIKGQIEKYNDEPANLNKLLNLMDAFLKILTIKADEPGHISQLRFQCQIVRGEIFLKLGDIVSAQTIFTNILPKDYNKLPSWLLMSVAHQLMQLSDPKETEKTNPPRVLLALIIVIKRGESDAEASYAKELCITLLKDKLIKGGWADKKSEKTYEELLRSYYEAYPENKKFIESALKIVNESPDLKLVR